MNYLNLAVQPTRRGEAQGRLGQFIEEVEKARTVHCHEFKGGGVNAGKRSSSSRCLIRTSRFERVSAQRFDLISKINRRLVLQLLFELRVDFVPSAA